MENKIFDCIVIGGGPAGMTASIYLSKANKKVLVIEKYMEGGQMLELENIENYPSFENIDGMTLSNKMFNQSKNCGVDYVYLEVTDVDFENDLKLVYCKDKVFKGKSVIISTGISSKKLGLDKEKELFGRGVSYCAICDGNFFRNKICAVASNNMTGFKDAVYLSNLCQKVYLIDSKVSVLPNNCPENIELKNTQIKKILGQDFVEGIELDNGNKIEINGVFVNIGKSPASLIFEGKLELDDRGYIITDDRLETSKNGVFACGDVRKNNLKQIVTACSEGALAGVSALKICVNYDIKNKNMH